MLASEAAYLRLAIDYYDFLARHIKAIADFQAIQRGARRGAIGGGAMSAQPMDVAMPSAAPTTSAMEMR
ncbi:MAG TPA: hypothetical protein VEK79_14375 [Thermoanaerobaculia bacterium]|nr:hypothetical protein [Thermoanaerobaculia bacterium]